MEAKETGALGLFGTGHTTMSRTSKYESTRKEYRTTLNEEQVKIFIQILPK